ncbi:MAG: type VI secretion system VasD/TssJ family lipoprotein [Gammaproteobacteria bacterium]
MFHTLKWLIYIGLLFLVVSCSSTPTELTVEEEEWIYEVRAINLAIRAAADVNSVSGRPHSIAVGIFQMNDPNTFSGLAVTREGAVELLQKGKIDDTIVNFQLVTLRPGELKKISISRAQTAKYIGVINGYFKLNPKTDIKVFPIPVRAIKRGLVEKTLAFTALIADQAKAVPGKLNIYIDLGRTGSKQIVALEDEIIKQNRVTSEKQVTQQESWLESLKSSAGSSE